VVYIYLVSRCYTWCFVIAVNGYDNESFASTAWSEFYKVCPELIRGHAIASRIREPYDPPRGFRLYFDPPQRSALPRRLGSPSRLQQMLSLFLLSFPVDPAFLCHTSCEANIHGTVWRRWHLQSSTTLRSLIADLLCQPSAAVQHSRLFHSPLLLPLSGTNYLQALQSC